MMWLIDLGQMIVNAVYVSGEFCTKSILQVWRGMKNWQGWYLVLKQFYLLCFRSLSIIILCAAFVGAIITYQGYITLDQFGSSEGLSQLVALSLYRELGPVLTALLFAGRSASSVTAELVLMRTGDQIDAIKVMGGSISGLLIMPRYLASWTGLVFLTLVFNAVAVCAGALMAQAAFDMDIYAFLERLRSDVPFNPNITSSIVKSLLFAVWISFVMVYNGFHSPKTNQGIAAGVTQTVVASSIGIFVIDYLLTVFFPIGG